MNGEDVITEYKKAYKPQRTQLFFSTELQKIDKDSDKLITTQDIEKLNKIDYNAEKEVVVEEKKVHQTRSKTKEKKEEKEKPEVKVHQTRSRVKNSPETNPIEDSPETKPPEKKVRPKPKPVEDSPAPHRFNLRERKKVSYKV